MKGVTCHKHFALIALFFLVTGCATYKSKYAEPDSNIDIKTTKEISHTLYLIGDAGLSPMNDMNAALKIFKQKLDKADKNSTAIFLGDNIYPAGLPDSKDSTQAYRVAKNHLDAQLETLENYKGKRFFIPGNHDWYTEGLVGLQREQDYIEKKLNSNEVFYPRNGCPITTLEINDDVVIIVIDTEWYLTNWDKRPDINKDCEIKDREKFLEELEGEIKKNIGRTTIIAAHHPMFTYGVHGGQNTFKEHFYPKKHIGPLPFLGTFVNVLRRTAGASVEDIGNKRYNELKHRLVTLAQYSDKVILSSGHEHTLQYIVENNTPQIVSGAGAKKGATRLLNGSQFSTGHMGYATLEVYTDGSSRVRFFGVDENENEEFLYTTQVLPPDTKFNPEKYKDKFPEETTASIYTKEEIEKNGFYKTLWGKRYREYYGTEVTVPTVNIDTLFGGLKPVRKGGGHQSSSLRLRHTDGREFVMRALRKDSELYLQAMVFKNEYVINDLEDSYLQKFFMDFYTGAHPYAPFTVGKLSDAIGIYHTNPKLYYVPKQPALENFNVDFGNELYMIEEHTGDGHKNVASFGFTNKLKSTDAMLDDLRDDEKYEVDSELYLRARLFDMVLGDWDRHVDQWRWAEFKEEGKDKTIYKPVPRDRDQVYSIMGDGLFMNLATRVIPTLRLMEGFHKDIRSVAGFNASPQTYVLDVALLSEVKKEIWIKQAKYIQENLTEKVIDDAFEAFPEEVRDETIVKIKEILLARIAHIQTTSAAYFDIINKYVVVTGTDKDDRFEVNYLNDSVEISGYRIKDGQRGKRFYHNTLFKKVTKEIWVYGLNDDDHFIVKGKNTSGIKVRLVGGYNNDIYDVGEGSGTYVYDYKSKKNTFENVSKAKVRLTDSYDVNTYRPLNFKSSSNQLIPTIGFNPDDGVRIGVENTYTFNGFRQNPFTQRHRIAASYYFATNGFDVVYQGEFAHITEKANLQIDAHFTSPNFAINFFGFGNNTENLDDDLGLDFNRVRFRTINFSPNLVWRGPLGSKFRTGITYESIDVEETADRFIDTFFDTTNEDTDKSFAGIDAEYSYANSDNDAFPTIGMATSLRFGYKTELSNGGGSFGFIIPQLSFDYRIVPSGRLVLSTKWKAHFNIGDDFQFYQGASIGGIDGLRGFRNQRFTGKKSFYQNTDVRLNLGRSVAGILPTKYGIFGGFDYGRVWFPNENFNRWHTSYGGGFFLNAAEILVLRASLFNSTDGLRFAFGLGFEF